MAEIVQKDPVTEAGKKTVSSRSHFSLGAPRLYTYRFGEYGCMDAVEVVPDDRNFQVALRHKLLTYTLGQPLLSKSMVKKDLFYVPAQCILPLNWDKVYTNPLHGQDVDASRVGCTVTDFQGKLAAFFVKVSAAYSALEANADSSQSSILENRLKFWILGEMFYSNGCLLHQLGVKLQSFASISGFYDRSFDKGFDLMISDIKSVLESFTVSGFGDDIIVSMQDVVSVQTDRRIMSLREFLCFARDDFSWRVSTLEFKSGKSALPETPFYIVSSSRLGGTIDVNLARPIAYQICCAHYYSNDKIDYVYDANLYRQNVYNSMVRLASANYAVTDVFDSTFTVNGSVYRYDYLSAFHFNGILSALPSFVSSEMRLDFFFDDVWIIADYLRLLFGFNRSLRYADYFTNAKSEPLAVGDRNVAVGASGVNVIDMVRGIQVNRFLNAVNRFGRRLSEYTKGLFPGVHQTPDFHDPFFLAHTTDVIGSQEIENTADGQRDRNSITTILRSDAGKYAFETDFEKPGIFIGIIYFDIERCYSNGVDRAVQHVDRYDMFNPFMQFTGDQDIRANELFSSAEGTFGYGLNYIEYKTRVPQCSGGFVENLPGYAFLAEDGRRLSDDDAIHISPSFIRSIPSELDKFYSSLSGYSLGSYFHFIVVLNNSIEVDRPMVYAPSLL